MLDLQKASVLKRISAYILDLILLCVLATGFAALISLIVNFNGQLTAWENIRHTYEENYHISLDVTDAEISNMTEEEMAPYLAADEALSKDKEAQRVYGLIFDLSLLIVSLGIFFACLSLEFVLPLILGNGQTVGKKVFGIAVMRVDGVRLNTLQLFVRTVLGKYAVETMIPVLAVLMLLLGVGGVFSLAIMGILLLAQIISVIATKTNSAMHDLMAATVTVDMASQMIFDTPEELVAYKQKLQAEKAASSPY